MSTLLPSGSTADRTSSPLAGHIRFNSQTARFEGYDGSAWIIAQTVASNTPAFIETPATITTNKIIAANTNAAMVGNAAVDS